VITLIMMSVDVPLDCHNSNSTNKKRCCLIGHKFNILSREVTRLCCDTLPLVSIQYLHLIWSQYIIIMKQSIECAVKSFLLQSVSTV